jgi:dTDP-4-amino-4,6-dideoxygalactose transaminase
VDPGTHQLDPRQVDRALQDDSVSAILAVNLWGDACQHEELSHLAKHHGIPLYYDSAHAIGCEVDGRSMGGFGALEVFSFHATKVLSAAEGGCISTDDDELAARLRNIRSSYGAGHSVHVRRTANGRMSEAQAAIALLSLKSLTANIERNQTLYEIYASELAGVPGLRLLRPQNVSCSNYQYVVCEIDASTYGLSRNQLHAVLKAENVLSRRYFYPGIHRCTPYIEMLPRAGDSLPVTEALCERVLQFPIGHAVDARAVARITGTIRAAQAQALAIRRLMEGTP